VTEEPLGAETNGATRPGEEKGTRVNCNKKGRVPFDSFGHVSIGPNVPPETVQGAIDYTIPGDETK
jgi:hypothetical protein